MKPKPNLSESDRAAFAAAFERAAHAIPSVRDVRFGRRVTHGAGYEHGMPDTADYLAVIAFDDLAGLQAYLGHPAHDEVGVKFGEALSSALVYDFDLTGLADIAKRG
jgi:Stress responsive A/B Barrel Domain